ncbi:MAG: trimethylamine methyltransferase family protein, partial [Desulfobacterales bacterium]|nr:trimethylamine methyltransferase family protein [Desulfobacterales bacterium]
MTPIDRIYNHALRILEEVGIDLKHAGAVELVKNNGVQTKGERAYFTGDQIRRWIRRTPSAFLLHAANPLFNIRIGEGKPRFVSG